MAYQVKMEVIQCHMLIEAHYNYYHGAPDENENALVLQKPYLSNLSLEYKMMNDISISLGEYSRLYTTLCLTPSRMQWMNTSKEYEFVVLLIYGQT